MCWECDYPESSHQDFLDHMQGVIDRVGWAVVYADDRGHCPWDAGFRGHHGGQPVLGVRAAPPTRGAAPRTQVA
jgi:hypothetical protein